MLPKLVCFDPLPNPIPPCCDAAKGRTIRAVPSVRVIAGTDIGELGYVLESDFCDCLSRWVPHQWGKGHARFVNTQDCAVEVAS